MKNLSEAKRELHGLFQDACYQAIRDSGLEEMLKDNRAWDDLAAEYGMKAMEFVDGLCEAKLTQLCDEKMEETKRLENNMLVGVGHE